jgi:hypothetical protein
MAAASASSAATAALSDVGAKAAAVRPDGRIAIAWDDGRVDVVDLRYFDRALQGNQAYQRSRLATR